MRERDRKTEKERGREGKVHLLRTPAPFWGPHDGSLCLGGPGRCAEWLECISTQEALQSWGSMLLGQLVTPLEGPLPGNCYWISTVQPSRPFRLPGAVNSSPHLATSTKQNTLRGELAASWPSLGGSPMGTTFLECTLHWYPHPTEDTEAFGIASAIPFSCLVNRDNIFSPHGWAAGSIDVGM